MNSEFEIEEFDPSPSQPASIHPRRVRPSRGEQILTQSVAVMTEPKKTRTVKQGMRKQTAEVGTETQTMEMEFELALRKLSAEEQKKASDRIYTRLDQRGVNIGAYFTEAPNILDTATKWGAFINKEDNRIRDTIRLIQLGRAKEANVNYMEAINPYILSPTKLGESSSTPRSIDMTTESSLSGANTAIDAGAVGQGVARNAKPAENPLSY